MISYSKRKRSAEEAQEKLNRLNGMLQERNDRRLEAQHIRSDLAALSRQIVTAGRAGAECKHLREDYAKFEDLERRILRAVEEDIANGLPDLEIRSQIEALEAEIQVLSTPTYIDRIVTAGSPSTVEKAGLYKVQMQEPGQPLYDCCFPSDAQPPLPLSLAHRVFGEFLDDFNNVTDPLDDELCNFGVELSFHVLGRMQKFEAEKGFQMAFNQKLEVFLGHSVAIDVAACGTAPNSASLISDLTVKAVAKREILGELKLEKGNTLAQGLQSFAIYVGQQDDETKLLPCFLIEVIGPTIRIGGLAFFKKVAWQPLTPFINGFYTEHDRTDMAMLCRAMRALKKGVTALDSYYRGAHPPVNPIGRKDIPYRLQGRKCERISNKLVFLVTLEDEEQRIFKYCRQYGEEVHRSWAEKNLAPILYGCKQIAGGWWEVEMEYLADWSPYSSFLVGMHGAELQAAISGALREASAIQIDGCPVAHGDMRPPNIMIKRDSGGGFNLKFIDFDWAGKVGVARYPPFMNTVLQWHPGVGAGKLLEQTHDTWWMQLPTGATAPWTRLGHIQPQVQMAMDQVEFKFDQPEKRS